jgi:hypothetical protein
MTTDQLARAAMVGGFAVIMPILRVFLERGWNSLVKRCRRRPAE